MHILSDHQFQQITTALEQAFVAINACQHVELDMTKPAVAPVAKAVKTTSVQQPKSQTKTRVSRRRTRGALNERQVLEIKRQLQAGGKSVAKIAKEFGVHSTTINCIKWGKTWKHVSLQQEPVQVVL